jgi:hypothetical protein
LRRKGRKKMLMTTKARRRRSWRRRWRSRSLALDKVYRPKDFETFCHY